MSETLPSHGPIACRQCWPTTVTGSVFETSEKRFRVVNDPGAWGAAEPEVLILGISKGLTQAGEFAKGDFDAVAFKNCRDRLQAILVLMGVMDGRDDIDQRMSRQESRLAWGSVVRCSLTGWNKSAQRYSAGTPDVLPAFKHAEARRFLEGCTSRFLSALPKSVKVVILLGNDDRYIDAIGTRLLAMDTERYRRTCAVSHTALGTSWVHVAHPSPGNGHFSQFISGSPDTGQGEKRVLAQEALARVRAS